MGQQRLPFLSPRGLESLKTTVRREKMAPILYFYRDRGPCRNAHSDRSLFHWVGRDRVDPRDRGIEAVLEATLGRRVDLVRQKAVRERLRPIVEKDSVRVA